MPFLNKSSLLFMLGMAMPFISFAQQSQTLSLSVDQFDVYNVTLKATDFKGKQALSAQQTVDLDSDNRYSFARLKDFDFHNGVIEIKLSGEPKKNAPEGARGFVGIAFRIPEDTSRFEVIYIRPTNGRAEDQVRRNHSTQYVSHPGFPWRRLRKDFPEKYESYVDLIAGEWISLKIEVLNSQAKLYVNGNSQPALIIQDLKQGPDLRGSIGLWLAIGTQAYFTELKVTKYD